MRKVLGLLIVAVLVMLAAFPAMAQETPGTIADIVVASATGEPAEFSTLLTAVQAADPVVLEVLSDPEQELTVFAPTDAAFAELAEFLGDDFNAILADPAVLTSILTFHVVPGIYISADVVGALDANEGQTISLPTVNGQYIDISGTVEGGIMIDGAPLNLQMVDIEASNGIIHVIDAVITPDDRTIADIVVEFAGGETPEFSLLLAAVQAADPAVLETLSNPDATLTVFAPTDAAFAALGEDTLNAVLADQEMLTNILLYHVVADGVYHSGAVADALMGDMEDMDEMADPEATEEAMMEEEMMEPMSLELTTAQGSPFTVTLLEDGSIMVNEANVIITDVDAANGVIHVIDAVILPAAE